MANLIDGLDPMLVFLVLLPMAALIAAWALRVSCNICDLDPPDYLHCLLAVVIVAVANVVLRFWLRINDGPVSFEAQVLAPLATTVLVLAMSIRTGPINACKVMVVQGILCGMLYCAALVMKKTLLVATCCGFPVRLR